jgi:hypothetical protein
MKVAVRLGVEFMVEFSGELKAYRLKLTLPEIRRPEDNRKKCAFYISLNTNSMVDVAESCLGDRSSQWDVEAEPWINLVRLEPDAFPSVCQDGIQLTGFSKSHVSD